MKQAMMDYLEEHDFRYCEADFYNHPSIGRELVRFRWGNPKYKGHFKTYNGVRFHDMSMQFRTEPVRKSSYLSRGERLRLSEELKHRTGELTLMECENKLFDIWSTLKLGRNRKKRKRDKRVRVRIFEV